MNSLYTDILALLTPSNIVSLGSLVVSVIAVIVSIRASYKNRVFYDLDLYRVQGAGALGNHLAEIKTKLNSGKYTVVSTFTETHPNGATSANVLIGRIKE